MSIETPERTVELIWSAMQGKGRWREAGAKVIRARDKAVALEILDEAIIAMEYELVLGRSPIEILKRIQEEYEAK